MDFTLKKYKELLMALQSHGEVALRHDVDKKPQNSLRTALMERELGWKAVYYFRAVPESWDESIVLQIGSMGHEIGYHYESLATCQGDVGKAYLDFSKNLEKMRSVVPVTHICMHGSPKSKWDSRDLWKHYDYHQLDVVAEPYLDTDFSKVFYLTDTGRRWDGYKVSVRDKVPQYQEQWLKEGLSFHTTDDIIRALSDPGHPIQHKSLLINTHPQRWTDNKVAWLRELVSQSAKNLVKRAMVLPKNV